MQSLGAVRLLGGVDMYLDREGLHDIVASREVLLVAAGNLSEEMPIGWGPQPPIRPLYIGTRLSPHLMTPEFVAHLKAQGPIGARDPATLELLRAHGVESYFSGCLTLTLQTSPPVKRQGVILVDLSDAAMAGLPEHLSRDALLVDHVRAPGGGMFVRPLNAARHADEPSRWEAMVGPRSGWKGLSTIEDLAHAPESAPAMLFPRLDRWEDNLRAVHELSHAQALLELYAGAELVVTSRLHCALPCLALGTPVVLITADDVYAPSRYGTFTHFQRRWSDSEMASIDWSPAPPDLAPHAQWLRGMLHDRLRERGVAVSAENSTARSSPPAISSVPPVRTTADDASPAFRNTLRNPQFDEWTRADSPIVYAGQTPAADHWRYFLHSSGVVADQSRRPFKLGQVDVEGAPRHYARVHVREAANAAVNIDLLQRLEHLELLAGEPATFSIYLRASRPCDARFFLLRFFGEGGDPPYYDTPEEPFVQIDTVWRRYAWRLKGRGLEGRVAGPGAHVDLTLRLRELGADTVVDLACAQLEAGGRMTRFDTGARDLRRMLGG
ncbi:polysaccharide pyruvyl transferase family protein [Caulobacter sp. Root655]|uniref:polysaccharide pyruvyl transferase family protein n=1 Tax=Caulobacter sp. Root655 TaxID=1736578 RepID=UPI00138EDE40|nr:polysaccharide pyruvyl transferase family protein [Caulobacter sp. Root655]